MGLILSDLNDHIGRKGVQKLFIWRFHQGGVFFFSPNGLRLCGEKTPFSPTPALHQAMICFGRLLCLFHITALEAHLQFSGCPVYYEAVSGSQPVTGIRTCLVLWDSFFRIIRLQVLGKSCKMDTYNLKLDPQTPMGCLLQFFLIGAI